MNISCHFSLGRFLYLDDRAVPNKGQIVFPLLSSLSNLLSFPSILWTHFAAFVPLPLPNLPWLVPTGRRETVGERENTQLYTVDSTPFYSYITLCSCLYILDDTTKCDTLELVFTSPHLGYPAMQHTVQYAVYISCHYSILPCNSKHHDMISNYLARFD